MIAEIKMIMEYLVCASAKFFMVAKLTTSFLFSTWFEAFLFSLGNSQPYSPSVCILLVCF